jgi:pimeloyl-ACP methyl ester carboxylesterase
MDSPRSPTARSPGGLPGLRRERTRRDAGVSTHAPRYAAGRLHPRLRAIRDADQRALAHDIAVPTLVVAGDADAVTTVADATWLAENIPNAAMTILPAAHLANVEAASGSMTQWPNYSV